MNPATVTQQAMTEGEKETMFQTWAANAPQDPKRGWYSSLYTEYNTQTGEYCIKSMIEDYNDDNCIELIGLAEMTIEGLKYTETYNEKKAPKPTIAEIKKRLRVGCKIKTKNRSYTVGKGRFGFSDEYGKGSEYIYFNEPDGFGFSDYREIEVEEIESIN